MTMSSTSHTGMMRYDSAYEAEVFYPTTLICRGAMFSACRFTHRDYARHATPENVISVDAFETCQPRLLRVRRHPFWRTFYDAGAPDEEAGAGRERHSVERREAEIE